VEVFCNLSYCPPLEGEACKAGVDFILSSLGGGVTVVRLKFWERGRENGSFTVKEGNEVKDRVLETVGFQGANPHLRRRSEDRSKSYLRRRRVDIASHTTN
jgi:hypothetical protein